MYGLASAGNGHGGGVVASVTPVGVANGTVATVALDLADALTGGAELATRTSTASASTTNATVRCRARPRPVLGCFARCLTVCSLPAHDCVPPSNDQSPNRDCKVVIASAALAGATAVQLRAASNGARRLYGADALRSRRARLRSNARPGRRSR